MKTKAFAVVMSLCLSSASFAEGALAPQGLFYLSVPLGAASKQEAAPSLGFMLRPSPQAMAQGGNPMQRVPLVDLRYSSSGLQSLSLAGVDIRRLKASGGSSKEDDKDDVNWWIVGGIVGAAVLINNSNKSSGNRGKVAGGGGG